jgi:hypothetical protein
MPTEHPRVAHSCLQPTASCHRTRVLIWSSLQ